MLQKIKKVLLVLLFSVEGAFCSVYTVSWVNETSVNSVRFPLKLVPVSQSLYEKVPLASGTNLSASLFNGLIDSNKRQKILALDPSLYPGGSYFFEWKLFLVVEGKDIPVGRALFGINTDEAAISIGVISQSSIENDSRKVELFDGMGTQAARDALLAKNRVELYYNSMNYRHEDIGKIVIKPGLAYYYRLTLGLRAEALDIKNPHADHRVWGSFSIINKE